VTASLRIPKKWIWHYRALLHVRDALLRDRAEHARAIRVPLEHGGEDVVDVANDKSENATLLAEIRLEEAELAEVDAAIARLGTGTYGVCEMTGRAISAARLRALPWTRLSHTAALEAAARNARRSRSR
jgi:RNA polymerase-binding transcription factor DksA